MTRTNAGLMWGSVAMIAVLLQVFFTFLDSRGTATATAIEFSKAYFLLDSDMENYLCSDLSGDTVNEHIFSASQGVSKLGLEVKTARRYLEHVKTEIVDQGYDFAKVRLTALSRTYINPLFAWVARLFNIGKVYHIDETLELIKENGDWKVSGSPFHICSAD